VAVADIFIHSLKFIQMQNSNSKVEPTTETAIAQNRLLPAGLNGYYVIVGKKGNVHYHTLSCQRKTCIEKFLEGGMMTWKHCREFGWRCIKVDVSFKPCR